MRMTTVGCNVRNKNMEESELHVRYKSIYFIELLWYMVIITGIVQKDDL